MINPIIKTASVKLKNSLKNIGINSIAGNITGRTEHAVIKTVVKVHPDPEIETVYILCDNCKSPVCYRCQKWYRLRIEREEFRKIPLEKRKKLINKRLEKLRAIEEKRKERESN